MKDNEFDRITPEDAMTLLAKEGLNVTNEQAKMILDFLYKLADITLDIHLKKEVIDVILE